jgi:hypothetical protein
MCWALGLTLVGKAVLYGIGVKIKRGKRKVNRVTIYNIWVLCYTRYSFTVFVANLARQNTIASAFIRIFTVLELLLR